MIQIKNKSSIAKMEKAGVLLAEIFNEISAIIKPGVTTAQINTSIAEKLKQKGLVSRAKGYSGYRYESCISVNDEVIHGEPSDSKKLKDGDLVKIDICASWKNYCADMARMFIVGSSDDSNIKKFVDVAQSALDAGINKARSGNRLSDISAAIQHEVEKHGYGVIRDFAGHGIGKRLHEEPEVLNYGEPGRGPVLRPGMALAIEPMITMGDYEVFVAEDGWTVKTVDNSLTAHVEDTVIITEGEPNILTRHKGREK